MGSLELKGFICYSPQSDALSSAKTLREAFSSKGAIYFVEIEEETQKKKVIMLFVNIQKLRAVFVENSFSSPILIKQ